MKKFLALLLTAVLALSCVSATAESLDSMLPYTVKTTYTVNPEPFAQLMNLSGVELTDEDVDTMNKLMAVLNNLGESGVVTESGMEAAVTLKDYPIMNVSLGMNDEKIILLSDLFPNSAVTLSFSTLEEVMGALEAALDGASMDVDLSNVEDILDKYLTQLGDLITANAGDFVSGFYAQDGKVFNSQAVCTVNGYDLELLADNAIKELLSDPNVAMLVTMMAQASGEDFDVNERIAAIDSTIAYLTSELEGGYTGSVFTLTLYTNVDESGVSDSMYLTLTESYADDWKLTMSTDENENSEICLYLMAGRHYDNDMQLTLNTSEDALEFSVYQDGAVAMDMQMTVLGDSVNAVITAGDPIYASLNQMRQAAIDGTGDAGLINLSFTEMNAGLQMRASVYSAGVFMGLDTTITGTDDALLSASSLYLLNETTPLLESLSEFTFGEGEGTYLTLDGKTEYPLEQLAQDESGALLSALMNDVAANGLNEVLANAAAAMPDEIIALITMLNTPSNGGGSTVEGIGY